MPVCSLAHLGNPALKSYNRFFAGFDWIITPRFSVFVIGLGYEWHTTIRFEGKHNDRMVRTVMSLNWGKSAKIAQEWEINSFLTLKFAFHLKTKHFNTVQNTSKIRMTQFYKPTLHTSFVSEGKVMSLNVSIWQALVTGEDSMIDDILWNLPRYLRVLV